MNIKCLDNWCPFNSGWEKCTNTNTNRLSSATCKDRGGPSNE